MGLENMLFLFETESEDQRDAIQELNQVHTSSSWAMLCDVF